MAPDDANQENLFATFCKSANSLSDLYTKGMEQQKRAFEDGHRTALRKLQAWTLMKQQQGVSITRNEIYAYLQHELEHVGGEIPISQPFAPEVSARMASSSQMQQANLAPETDLDCPMDVNVEQSKESGSSDPMLSPVRRSLMAVGEDYSGCVSEGSNNPNDLKGKNVEIHASGFPLLKHGETTEPMVP